MKNFSVRNSKIILQKRWPSLLLGCLLTAIFVCLLAMEEPPSADYTELIRALRWLRADSGLVMCQNPLEATGFYEAFGSTSSFEFFFNSLENSLYVPKYVTTILSQFSEDKYICLPIQQPNQIEEIQL